MGESILDIPRKQFDQLSWSNLGTEARIYVIVFALGGLLGATEVLGRYTDSPMAALKSPGAFVYVLVNGFASVIALYLILQLAPEIKNPIYQVLLAGLGAMVFLRSSLFKAKVADQDVAVGPVIVLDTLLNFADSQVDRGRAVDRASRIGDVMRSLPIAQAHEDLPELCFALMQNLPVDTRESVKKDITVVATDIKRSEPVKVMQIGLVLWTRVGIGPLTGAVDLLKRLSGSATVAGEGAVPSPPRGKPEDLLPQIERQLAKDRESFGAGVEPKAPAALASEPKPPEPEAPAAPASEAEPPDPPVYPR
jgi:hypothetical protein